VSDHDKSTENGADNDASNSNAEGSSQEVSDIEKAQAEAEKYKNEYLYLRAEFENYKRHAIKERSELLKYAGERMAKDLLGIIDNFDRALAVEVKPETLSVDTYVKGIEMTAKDLKGMLEKHGIKEVPSEKTAFDPHIHEALGSEPTDIVQEGHVLRVFEKPYKYFDKILRPGKVIIARKPEA
jgi:molecular chaperone GrpE